MKNITIIEHLISNWLWFYHICFWRFSDTLPKFKKGPYQEYGDLVALRSFHKCLIAFVNLKKKWNDLSQRKGHLKWFFLL